MSYDVAMSYDLAGKTVHLVLGPLTWQRDRYADAFTLGPPIGAVATIWLDTKYASVWTNISRTGRAAHYDLPIHNMYLSHCNTLREMELAIYADLVEHGLLDPLVAVLL